MQFIVHTLGIKNVFKSHMRSEGPSWVGKETEPSKEATDIFPIAPLVDSNTTDARSAEVNLYKGLKPLAPGVGQQQPEKGHTMPRELPPALPLQLLILTPKPGFCSPRKLSAITADVLLEFLPNLTSFKLRYVAEQPKYNMNPRRWPQFGQDFKAGVEHQKLHENEFLTALWDCLEGPPANTLL